MAKQCNINSEIQIRFQGIVYLHQSVNKTKVSSIMYNNSHCISLNKSFQFWQNFYLILFSWVLLINQILIEIMSGHWIGDKVSSTKCCIVLLCMYVIYVFALTAKLIHLVKELIQVYLWYCSECHMECVIMATINPAFWAPSQYKDRLIYVWRFPC